MKSDNGHYGLKNSLISGEAKIYRVTALQSDASESNVLSTVTGKTIRLHGRNLSFDIADNAQGVFLENETGLVRIENYNRRGSNIVDIVVPSNLGAESYSISIVTKPGNTYFTVPSFLLHLHKLQKNLAPIGAPKLPKGNEC